MLNDYGKCLYRSSGFSTFSPDESVSKQARSKLFGPALGRIKISTPETARLICDLIPNTCPFERDVTVFGHKLFHIPALCKLNPLYESLVELRFRALVFLADECGEDVTQYCQ